MAMAQQTVVLSNVFGPTGVSGGVITHGPGTLTVGAGQDINTANNVVGVSTDAADTANIVFTGSSNVNGLVGATGATFLNIAAGANAATVTFNGAVVSTTFSLTGNGTINFNRGFTSNTGSTLDFGGDGFINVAAGQTVKAALTNTAGAGKGTLTLNGGSIFNGAVGAASGLRAINVVGGNALITGQANAAQFNLGTNTLNVGGALAMPVAGVINTTIFSPILYGKITPVGFATIGNALQINVTVTGPIADGTSFNIVDATSGSTGSTVIATDNSLRYKFVAAPTAVGLVRITATQVPLADIVTPVVAGGGGAPGVSPVVPIVVAAAVDGLPVNATTTPLLTAITLLPTAIAIADALEQLGPGTANFAGPQVSYRTTQRFQDQWASHMEAEEACMTDSQPNDRRQHRLKEEAVCQGGDMRSHLWVTGIGFERSPFSSAKQGNSGGFEGYDSRILGMTVNYDMPLSAVVRAGVGIRYAHANIDGNASSAGGAGHSSHAETTSYQATAYIGYAPGPWFANGALVFGEDRYSGTRHVAFTGVDSTLTAAYHGNQFTAFGTTGYHAYLGDGLTVITPFASLQYTALRTDPYTEAGNAAINLTVASQEYNFIESTLGAKIARTFPMSGSKVLQPEVHAKWLHAMGDTTITNTANFTAGGPAFTISGLRADPNTFNVGAGLTFAKSGRWAVEGSYDYLWRSQNYAANQLMVSFVLKL